jgi:hypothetical protein
MTLSSPAPKPVFTFTSLAHWPDKRSRWEITFAVPNPKECSDFRHLKGKIVQIDGLVATVVNVETPIHDPPWRKDERIALGVNLI